MDDATRAAVAAWADAAVADAVELDGGEVGTVHRVDLADGRRVVAKTGPTDLQREARALAHLAETGGLPTPAVHHATPDLLVLGFVPGDGAVTPAVERDLADHIAALHATTADAFGFPFDTAAGEVAQPNPRTDSWPAFFGEHRLGHAADLARERDLLPPATVERITELRAVLPDVLDHDPAPALVHGDVWTGNVVTDGERVRALLDPAPYYGDREVDLAYVRWTDTGGPAFRARYREAAGIPDGAADREPVYRVYYLLVHLLHFGEQYRDGVRAALAEAGY
jgi:fructosamine-3-kinase